MANEGAKAGDDAGEDPLNFRPNPEALVSKVDEARGGGASSNPHVHVLCTIHAHAARSKPAAFTPPSEASHPPFTVWRTGLSVCVRRAFLCQSINVGQKPPLDRAYTTCFDTSTCVHVGFMEKVAS